MKWQLALALVATFTLSAHAQFVENFDDGSAGLRWSDPIVDSEFGTFDGAVNYGFDYSGLGIGSAPNGGGSIGVQFMSNLTDETAIADEGESVAIISNLAVMPAGDFVLQMDVYYNVDSGASGTTEYITLGGFTAAPNAPLDNGLNDDVPFRFGVSDGNGLAFQVTGDGGSATDVVQFQDAGNANTGSQTNIGSLDNIPFGNIPGVVTGGGDPGDPFALFGFQNNWATISIESAGGMIDYKLNGVSLLSELGSPLIDNTGGTYSGGSIMIGLNDIFNSVSGPAVWTLIDNVTLTETVVPEPTSLLLGAMALCGLATTRRRV